VAEHVLVDTRVHFTWSPRHEPVLTVRPGDSIRLRTRDGFDGQMAGLAASELDETLAALDFGRIAPLTGPVHVDGAQPGDVVAVEIRSLVPSGPGWTVIWPAWCGFDYVRPHGVPPGASVREFPDGSLRPGGRVGVGRVQVPVRPMLGMVGTAPPAGEFTTLPPRAFGGNLDLRLIAPGATVYLPVFVPGAALSFGDGHAAQGDGEVCTTAIECAMDVEVQVDLVRGRWIDEPELRTADAYVVTGYGRDLDEAAGKAIRFMHRHLVEVRGLSPQDAYMLMSLTGDLGVNQVVDLPHVGARFSIPLEVLGG
jgi:acetamidase/formamidase